MSTRKLTAEIDVDATKAKRKLRELNSTGGGDAAGPVAPAADKAARSLERTAKGADELNEAAKRGGASLGQITKVFGGMAIRMAAGYAARSMDDGSAGQTAVRGVGNIASGAMAGAVAGPWGAVAGGVIGAVETALDALGEAERRQQGIDKYLGDFSRAEHNYASDKAWRGRLDSLTSVEDGFTDFAGRLAEINAELDKYREVEKTLVANVRAFAEAGDLDKAGLQSGYLNGNRQRQAQLEAAAKAMEAQEKAAGRKSHEYAANYSGLDAISRIGGGFGGGDYARQQLDAAKETVSVLKSIDQKTKGGTAWQ